MGGENVRPKRKHRYRGNTQGRNVRPQGLKGETVTKLRMTSVKFILPFSFLNWHTPPAVPAPASKFGVRLDGKPIRSTNTSYRFYV
jgi:hypothetical protein